jgi:hypothetical protein
MTKIGIVIVGVVLAALVYFSWSQPAPARPVHEVVKTCEGPQTRAGFIAHQIQFFGDRGQKIDVVSMTGEALDKFTDVLLEHVKEKKLPVGYYNYVKQWDELLWAVFKDQNGKQLVGIAAVQFGCVQESEVWSIDVWVEHIEKAFGKDA